MVDANGVELYKSCKSVLPRDMTGSVAYMGIRVNNGKCLQQCANAARWATVACVRRIKERVGTCLEMESAFHLKSRGRVEEEKMIRIMQAESIKTEEWINVFSLMSAIHCCPGML